MSFEQYLQSRSNAFVLMLAVLAIALIGYVDYITGYEISVSIFYAAPILLAAWFLNRKSTVFVVVLCATVRWWTDRAAGRSYSAHWVEIWDSVVRLFFFAFIAIAGIAIKSRRDNMAQLVANMRRMRELELEVVAAGERERQRIGADLHDGLCQYLAGLTCVTSALQEDLSNSFPPLAGTAAELHELLTDAVIQSKSIARGIAPVHMDEDGLVSALGELAATTRMIHHIDCAFESEGEAPVANPEVATHLYRIAQEATSNAVRHGKATVISLLLAIRDRQITLTVQDNGIGITNAKDSPAGMGLRSMRYRTGVLNGTLEITAPPEGGTRVCCRAPLAALEKPDLANAN